MSNKVFISWSSDDPRVEKTARNFQKWFSLVFEGRIKFFNSKDIKPGIHAREEINRQLDTVEFAFFFLSRRTAKSSWVIFEAGCLRRLFKEGNAYFLLTDIAIDDFRKLCPPLEDYQASMINSTDDIKAIVSVIGEKLGLSSTEILNINARWRRMWNSSRRATGSGRNSSASARCLLSLGFLSHSLPLVRPAKC